MSRSRTKTYQSFVVEIDGRSIVALLSTSKIAALEMCQQDWFTEELSHFKSNGLPLWDGKSEFHVRPATRSEAVELEIALARELANDEYGGFLFSFLTQLDPIVH